MDRLKIVNPNIRASDSRSWLSCKRRVWLEHTDLITDGIDDPFLELIKESGIEHESVVLEELKATHEVHYAKSKEDTQALMTQRADVIYQGKLIDSTNNIVGNPDFLFHKGDGQYQPADVKLSNNELKGEIQIQIGVYQKLLNNGLPGIVYRGDGTAVEINIDGHKKTDDFVATMQELLANDSEPAVKYAHSKCRACPYFDHCAPVFEERQDTSLVYDVDGRISTGLENIGIRTISELAAAEVKDIPDIPYLKKEEKSNDTFYRRKLILMESSIKQARSLCPKALGCILTLKTIHLRSP